MVNNHINVRPVVKISYTSGMFGFSAQVLVLKHLESAHVSSVNISLSMHLLGEQLERTLDTIPVFSAMNYILEFYGTYCF